MNIRTVKSKSGQALVEYVVLLAVVAGVIFLLFKQLPKLFAALEAPLRKDYRFVYKYGDKDTRGFNDEGETGPVRHPRYSKPNNFRLFGRGPS